MWIREQHGGYLQKITNIGVSENNIVGKWEIVSDIENNMCILGEYTSENEALKVLDLIQCQHDMDVYEHGPEGMRVFQMPPKGFTRED